MSADLRDPSLIERPARADIPAGGRKPNAAMEAGGPWQPWRQEAHGSHGGRGPMAAMEAGGPWQPWIQEDAAMEARGLCAARRQEALAAMGHEGTRQCGHAGSYGFRSMQPWRQEAHAAMEAGGPWQPWRQEAMQP